MVGISSSCCDSIFVIFNKLRDGHCSSHKIDNSKYFVIDFSNTGYRSCFKIPGAQLLFERTVQLDFNGSLSKEYRPTASNIIARGVCLTMCQTLLCISLNAKKPF